MPLVTPILRHGNVPAHLQIKEQLKANIRLAQLPPHCMLPNLKTLAQEAGVSIRTVDLAIRELVSEGLCYRRTKKGTFIAAPDMAAEPAVAVPVRRNIALLPIPNTELHRLQCDLTDLNLHRGFNQAAAAHASDLVMVSYSLEEALEFYAAQQNIGLRGVVLMEFNGIDEVTQLALRYPTLKFVYANYFFEFFENTPDNVYGVFNDDFAGAYRIAAYFLSRGFRRPAICSMNISDLNYANRIRGFQQAVRDQSLAWTPPVLHGASGDAAINIGTGYQAAQELSALPEPPDVIFCTNDHVACGIMQYWDEHPEARRTVAGYDGQLPFGYETYRFSTVQIDFHAIGERAVDIVCSDRYCPKQVRIQPELKLI